jgi:hypothetical protein
VHAGVSGHQPSGPVLTGKAVWRLCASMRMLLGDAPVATCLPLEGAPGHNYLHASHVTAACLCFSTSHFHCWKNEEASTLQCSFT